MIYMTAAQAEELDLLDMDIRPGSITIVSEAKLAEINAAAFA